MKKGIPLALMLLASTAASAERPVVIIGDHPGFGRMVIRMNASGPVTLKQHDGVVDLFVPSRTEITAPSLVPRNVLRFSGGRGSAKFAIPPGATIRTSEQGKMLIIDVLDPPSRDAEGANIGVTRANPAVTRLPGPTNAPEVSAKAEPVRPEPAKPLASTPEPVHRDQAAPRPEKPAPQTDAALPAPKPEPAPATPAAPQPTAQAASKTPTAAPAQAAPADDEAASATPQAFVLAAPNVGAVAFRRGDLGIVVFDSKVTLDRSDDGDEPAWATAHDVQNGTMLTVPLAADETLNLRRDADGWMVKIGSPSGSPTVQTLGKDGIQFQLSQPGRAMTVSDPITGQTLLLGTSRQGHGEHNMNDERRSAPGYTLLPTWLGLALETTSDAVDLRPSMSGYILALADGKAPGSAMAAIPENTLGIPTGPIDSLVRQLNAEIASAGAAPPRGRGLERVAAARTMLALGMATEAQALFGLAANDDPAIAHDPAVGALDGIAAILADRPTEATGLDNPALPTGGDIALWRGIRNVAEGKPAPALDANWGAVEGYPDAIKQRITAPVMETAIKDGVAVPEKMLQGPSLGIARAFAKEHAGEVDAALKGFDDVADSRDERDSVRATIAATELRLAKGLITPQAAADKLEAQSVRWRGDGQELQLRLRAAELRTKAGQFRDALEALRGIEQTFPTTADKVAPMKTAVVKAILNDATNSVAPLELVTIAGEFADCIPDGPDGKRMAGLLADKLAALDLPSRAIPVLQKLFDKTDADATKVEFGLRLAQMQLDAGAPDKADSVLSAVDPTALTSERRDQRTLLLARAKAGQGDPAAAAQMLASLQTDAATELRAKYFAQAKDWPRSLEALQILASKTVPDTGDLTDQQQDLVLREATAAVQAGDADTLRRLKAFDARMKAPRADLFRVLTATAVQGPADLPRAARELAMSRTLPDRIDALKLR